MNTAVYQARQIKRRRRTRAQVEQLDAEVVDVLLYDQREHLDRGVDIMSNYDSDEAEALLPE